MTDCAIIGFTARVDCHRAQRHHVRHGAAHFGRDTPLPFPRSTLRVGETPLSLLVEKCTGRRIPETRHVRHAAIGHGSAEGNEMGGAARAVSFHGRAGVGSALVSFTPLPTVRNVRADKAPLPSRPTLADLLDIELPIIQAPMAGVQGAALAVAVTNAGALGSLPCATLGPETLRSELTMLREQASGPFNVNFFCHTPPVFDDQREAAWRATLAPYYAEFGIDPRDVQGGPGRLPFDDAVADVVEPFRPAVVSFHFGLPSPALVSRVRGWGAKIISSATTVDEALWLERHGVDVIVAQGLEAGGHRGMFLSEDLRTQLGTFALVPQITRAVSVPVIAAGGIADGTGIAAAMALGAAGVQLGTTWLLCPEATTSDIHRSAITSAKAAVTALTNVFTGRPARGILNRLMTDLGPISQAAPDFPLAVPAVAPLRAAAERLGSGDFSPLWAGQNVTGCKAVAAGVLTRALAVEAGLT